MSKRLSVKDMFLDLKGREKEAQEILGKIYAKSYNELEKDVNGIFAKIQELETKEKFADEKSRADFLQRIRYQSWMKDRLRKIQDQIDKQAFNLGINVRKNIIDMTSKAYMEKYNYSAYMIDKNTGVYAGWDILDKLSINRAFNNSIAGLVNYKDNGRDIHTITGSSWSDAEFATIKARINIEITSGIMKGSGLQDISSNIQKVMNQSYGRAERIARTETTRAYNAASNDRFEESKKLGIKYRKKWISAELPGRSRDSHIAMDGKLSDDDGYFDFKGEKVLGPGHTGRKEDDINCMCDMSFEDVELQRSVENYEKFAKGTNFEEWYNKALSISQKNVEISKNLSISKAEILPNIKLSKTAQGRMSDPKRYVSENTLKSIILNKKSIVVDDLQGSGAKMFYNTVNKNGQKYNVEVLYNKETDTIYHFLMTRDKRGGLPKVKKGESGGNLNYDE